METFDVNRLSLQISQVGKFLVGTQFSKWNQIAFCLTDGRMPILCSESVYSPYATIALCMYILYGFFVVRSLVGALE